MTSSKNRIKNWKLMLDMEVANFPEDKNKELQLRELF